RIRDEHHSCKTRKRRLFHVVVTDADTHPSIVVNAEAFVAQHARTISLTHRNPVVGAGDLEQRIRFANEPIRWVWIVDEFWGKQVTQDGGNGLTNERSVSG